MARILLPVKFLTPNLKSPWAVSYSNTNFGSTSAKIYTCFAQKTAFVMQNFRNLGILSVGAKIFCRNPKRYILALFHAFSDIDRANPFTGFCSRRVHEKKGHYEKSQRGYISRICGEFPTQPNSTKIGIRVWIADVINHTKFDNDRSREYKVTDGRILACSIGMACRL